jgi:hypothetical protein
MTNKYPSERAAALFNQAIDALRRVENAPGSPIEKFHSAKERKELRRRAIQLRRGQLSSPYPNVTSDAELADIYDRTVQRDREVEAASADFKKTERPLHLLAQEEGEAVALTFQMMYEAAVEGAILHGLESEDAQRLRAMHLIIDLGMQFGMKKRRQNESHRVHLTRRFTGDPALQRRYAMTAAEILAAPPDGEPVLAFPSEDAEPARGRIVMRIGLGPASWVGSFERGNTEHNTVQLLPDGKHLLVTAGGAGYILDLQSRALVERIGDDIVSVGDAYNRSVYFVNHGDRSFEAFGIPGRLWKTEAIGCGGFRGLDVEGEAFIGEARLQSEPEEWAPFSVSLRTGEVEWRAGG